MKRKNKIKSTVNDLDSDSSICLFHYFYYVSNLLLYINYHLNSLQYLIIVSCPVLVFFIKYFGFVHIVELMSNTRVWKGRYSSKLVGH